MYHGTCEVPALPGARAGPLAAAGRRVRACGGASFRFPFVLVFPRPPFLSLVLFCRSLPCTRKFRVSCLGPLLLLRPPYQLRTKEWNSE
eukprot:scaffold284214_cov28-Tisochrysis_lutea.AAC.1